MEFDVNDIFNEVRSSITTQPSGDNIWKNKLRFEAGKEYVLRLLPYIKEGREGMKKSLFKYQRYTWQDQSGKWTSVLSPRTWGGKCPIGDWSYRVKYKGTDEERADMEKRLFYKAGAYANVLVIKDPTNPENEGKFIELIELSTKTSPRQVTNLSGSGGNLSSFVFTTEPKPIAKLM